MSITKEQQQAIEEAAKEYADSLESTTEYSLNRHAIRRHFKSALEEVLNNPEKYGLRRSSFEGPPYKVIVKTF